MRISKLVGERTKDNPSDAAIASHALMVRAGFIKLVTSGVWSLAMPAKRIAQKIERIIRQEMDAIEGQEVSFPVVMPKELWAESGRYFSIGEEMVRFQDRNGRELVLGMTHEEAAVHLVRDAVNSYQQLPFMIYQLQTKFRDEARSRGGLIRVREFTMKDGYSFHESQEDLEQYYQRVYHAYERIFHRIGMKRVVAVKSDTGMMGGSVAHEYMLLTEVGEDTIVLCPACDYKANMEVAVSRRESIVIEPSAPMQEVFTGEHTDIEAVAAFLNVPSAKTLKAVCYYAKGTEDIVLCFIRGDLEVNEAKLKRILGKEIVPANLKDSEVLTAGNIGVCGLNLPKGAVVLYDKSLEHERNLVTGANKAEYHVTGLDMDRDMGNVSFQDFAKVKAGELCPICGQPLTIENGIEVGNIFQLGIKYTKAMDMTVLNRDGKAINPIMGCYGIGVGRAIASVAEESHDEKGLIWPMSIAPWQVYLCALRIDDETVREKVEELYVNLLQAGIEVVYDDREASAGVKFSDCDLMGIPIRLLVSPRSLKNGTAEVALRDGSQKEDVPLPLVIEKIKGMIQYRLE